MIKVVVTGSAKGIGKSLVQKIDFELSRQPEDYMIYGIDVEKSNLDKCLRNYTHIIADVGEMYELPDIEDVNYLVNNAGVQNSKDDIRTNLIGTINCTNKYGIQPSIRSIVNVSSVSAHNGAEFPEYVASKGGMLSYTVAVAKMIAKFGATCNSISPGGVITDLNNIVMNDKDKWNAIMGMTPLKKWATREEIAEWIYFMLFENKSMTGQDVLIDNGEMFNHTFVWD